MGAAQHLLDLRQVVAQPGVGVGADGHLRQVVGALAGLLHHPSQGGCALPAFHTQHLAALQGQPDGRIDGAKVVHGVLDDDHTFCTALQRRGGGLARAAAAETARAGAARQREGGAAGDAAAQVGAGGRTQVQGGTSLDARCQRLRHLPQRRVVHLHQGAAHHLGGDPAQDEDLRSLGHGCAAGVGVGERARHRLHDEVGAQHGGGHGRRRLLAVAAAGGHADGQHLGRQRPGRLGPGLGHQVGVVVGDHQHGVARFGLGEIAQAAVGDGQQVGVHLRLFSGADRAGRAASRRGR